VAKMSIYLLSERNHYKYVTMVTGQVKKDWFNDIWLFNY